MKFLYSTDDKDPSNKEELYVEFQMYFSEPSMKFVTELKDKWNSGLYKHIKTLHVTYRSFFFRASPMDTVIWDVFNEMRPGEVLENVVLIFGDEPNYDGPQAILGILKWLHGIGAKQRMWLQFKVFGYLCSNPDEFKKYAERWTSKNTIENEYVVYSGYKAPE